MGYVSFNIPPWPVLFMCFILFLHDPLHILSDQLIT